MSRCLVTCVIYQLKVKHPIAEGYINAALFGWLPSVTPIPIWNLLIAPLFRRLHLIFESWVEKYGYKV